VILDNLSTHAPTQASWLNQIGTRRGTLARQALKRRSFTSPRELRQAISRFVEAHSHDAAPFDWKESVVPQVQSDNSDAHLRR
jgi:hypothetical protein